MLGTTNCCPNGLVLGSTKKGFSRRYTPFTDYASVIRPPVQKNTAFGFQEHVTQMVKLPVNPIYKKFFLGIGNS